MVSSRATTSGGGPVERVAARRLDEAEQEAADRGLAAAGFARRGRPSRPAWMSKLTPSTARTSPMWVEKSPPRIGKYLRRFRTERRTGAPPSLSMGGRSASVLSLGQRSVVQVAGDGVAIALDRHRGSLLLADRHGVGAARMEAAARGGINEVGHGPGDRLELLVRLVHPGDRVEQPLGVRVERVTVELPDRRRPPRCCPRTSRRPGPRPRR